MPGEKTAVSQTVEAANIRIVIFTELQGKLTLNEENVIAFWNSKG